VQFRDVSSQHRQLSFCRRVLQRISWTSLDLRKRIAENVTVVRSLVSGDCVVDCWDPTLVGLLLLVTNGVRWVRLHFYGTCLQPGLRKK
jgi:hypothetical protein